MTPVPTPVLAGLLLLLFLVCVGICHWLDTHPRKDHHS